jgi:hypothetical protein
MLFRYSDYAAEITSILTARPALESNFFPAVSVGVRRCATKISLATTGHSDTPEDAGVGAIRPLTPFANGAHHDRRFPGSILK